MNLDLRIVVVGENINEMYGQAFYNALIKLGFAHSRGFWTNDYIENRRGGFRLIHKLQRKFAFGHIINEMNHELISQLRVDVCDLLFIYSSRLITTKTVRQIKKDNPLCKVFIYHNDNPFSNKFPKYYFRHYLGLIPIADKCYSYRESNIVDYKQHKCLNVSELRSYYIEERNYLIDNLDLIGDLDIPTVLFLGHYESDGREEYLRKLTTSGIKVGVTGEEWENHIEGHNGNLVLVPKSVSVKRYNDCINKAKICLVFLSTLNNDKYTRRCYEIPAAGSLMMSVYTDTISSMYQEDIEAVYFRTPDELLKKVQYYLFNESERRVIAENGHKRLLNDQNEVCDRVKRILEDYEEMLE